MRALAGLLLFTAASILLLPSCASQFKSNQPNDVPNSIYQKDPSWPPLSGQFSQVSWIDISKQTGNVYVLQRSQPALTIWSPGGQQVGSLTLPTLGDPHSVSLSKDLFKDDTIWITDMAPPQPAGAGFGHCLKRFTANGEPIGRIGKCAANSMGSGLNPVQFDKVTDVAVDSNGNLIVSDGDLHGLNNRVIRLLPNGKVLSAWSAANNQPGSGPGEFNLPHDVLVDDCQRVWVADALNHRIQVLGLNGGYYGQYQCFGSDGVYGIDMTNSKNGFAKLFVASSPSSGGGVGVVSVFNVPMSCSTPASIGSCIPITSWRIPLPNTPTTALLHSVAVSADGSSVYLAALGGDLPPQRWLRQAQTDQKDAQNETSH